MDVSVPGQPTPATAEQFRRAKVWYFEAGPGLVIQCRHLGLDDLLYTGTIPLPVLENFAAANGIRMSVVLEQPDRYKELLVAARRYAELAAITPRCSTERTGDPHVLYIGEDGESDLPLSVIVRLMNEGSTRRLGVDVNGLGLFRGSQPASAGADRSVGAAVSDAAESVAAADAAGSTVQ